ncbi:DNA gyrase subunit A [Caulobacter sp. NIBR1757]|uniref:DNA gyrase subunit A n=1 Tax=Caulobacter sp. NIBR1757 TaxID=3016000 RepID=UPI0022F0B076|nr:DNA gyrase subunit A [Caulobacter sp. NIBR1757]WGM38602.1 DNA gyrase subunit A [Caulobacter sp. NIBR1757]
MTDENHTPPDDSRRGAVSPIAIEDELRKSYLDYAMSVIVSRALPDARDGLKPVHRRVLFSMNEQGHTHDKPYVKCARVVGDVMGKYHPHGDQSIYDALVRMAQPFSMGLMLIDGQGNFGSVDNDPPAQMRYTECRMTRAAEAILADLDKDTVDFKDNYDGKEKEPVVLPSRIPNLLVNGSGGIAVGMATNVPPHNLGEIVDACLAMIDDPDISSEQLLDIVPGPDFPTGGEIVGRSGARQALLTGRGSVIMRGASSIETVRKDREAIVFTSLPYQVNKAALIERIAEMVRDKRIEGIGEMRDESDRQGMRVVIELKRDATPEVVLNQLHRFSAVQTSFGVNMLALNRGRPLQMGLKELLVCFVDFREEVVVRRAKFELSKARDRGHTLVGLAIAVANIDEVIAIIRSSVDPAEARERLVAKAWPTGDMMPLVDLIQDPRTKVEGDTIRLTDEQARGILALTLSRLTGLGRDEIFNEASNLSGTIAKLLELLSDRANIMRVVREELVEIREKFAVPRRTVIIDGDGDIEDEDLIPREEMVITVTHGGYVKRTPLSTYRSQRHGGKGRSGMATKEEDAVTRVFSASTHAPMLFFSSGGKVYKLKVWRLPLGTPTSRGKAFVNLLPIEQGETITSILTLPEDEATWDTLDVMFATRSGTVRRNKLSDFVQINRNGKIAMKLDPESLDGKDAIVGVGLCTSDSDVLLTTANGRAIRFEADDVRVFSSRDSMGVRGIRLLGDDLVISMAILRNVAATPDERVAYLKQSRALLRAQTGEEGDDVAEAPADEEEAAGDTQLSQERFIELGAAEETILTMSTEGIGKRSSAYDFRRTGRGGQGLMAQDLTRKGGRLVAAFPVEQSDEILLVTDQGQLIRCPVAQIRIAARNTQGVIVFRTGKDEHVVGVERLAEAGGDEDSPEGEFGGDDGPVAG